MLLETPPSALPPPGNTAFGGAGATPWFDTLSTLIRLASTDLPADVEAAIRKSLSQEEANSIAARTLDTLLENVALARLHARPLCQDTGALLFWIHAPPTVRQAAVIPHLRAAIAQATRDGILRQNCVDSLTGRNSGDNLGIGFPNIHWDEDETRSTVEISLLLKGGGSENVSAQYSLPDTDLGAGRDLDGVRRCVLHAAQRAQGMGCAPGILGVCIGGDRAGGYAESKRQLLRPLGVRSTSPECAALEERILTEANQLGIGPMGFGGWTTLLGVAVGCQHRVPASYFVTVAYMCWACRRQTIEVTTNGQLLRRVQ